MDCISELYTVSLLFLRTTNHSLSHSVNSIRGKSSITRLCNDIQRKVSGIEPQSQKLNVVGKSNFRRTHIHVGFSVTRFVCNHARVAFVIPKNTIGAFRVEPLVKLRSTFSSIALPSVNYGSHCSTSAATCSTF